MPDLTQADFFNLLTTNIQNLPIYEQSGRRLSSDRQRKDNKAPTVYSEENVDKLCAELDSETGGSIRYVIDQDKEPFFGAVGPLVGPTPGHEEMLKKRYCLSAGVLTLESDQKTIAGVSYRSGYFKPHLNSLIWILSYLVSDKSVFQLSETLKIAYLDDEVLGTKWNTVTINVQALINTLNHSLSARIALTEDNKPKICSSYPNEAPLKRVLSYESIAALLPPIQSSTSSLISTNNINENSSSNSNSNPSPNKKTRYTSYDDCVINPLVFDDEEDHYSQTSFSF